MRVLVTGSRDWPKGSVVFRRLNDLYEVATRQGDREFTVVHGHCPTGADSFAHEWCLMMHDSPVDPEPRVIEERHPAQWYTHVPECPPSHEGMSFCRKAGFRRNEEMVDAGADWYLAFIKDASRGASHTLDLAQRAKINGHLDEITTGTEQR